MLGNIIYACKLLLFICFILASFGAEAGSVSDTSAKKNGSFLNSNPFKTNESFNIFGPAREAFKHDSIAKGIEIVTGVLKNAENQKTINQTMDYRGLELCYIIQEADKSTFSVKEKQFLQDFISASVAQKDETAFKALEQRVKDLHPSPLTERIKLYFLSIAGSRQIGKEADKILKDSPDLLSINALKAEWLFDNSKYEESMLSCTKLIALAPNYPHAYELRGNNYARLDQPKKALEDFSQAIKLYPQNNIYYYDLASVQMSLEKYKEAVVNFRKMLNVHPDYLWINFNLAKCYSELKLADSAQYFVNLHIKQYPNDEEGYDLKGNIIAAQGDYANSLEQFNKALHFNSEREDFYEDRGDSYYYSDKYKDAIADYQKAMSLNKKRSYPAERLGDCYFQLKDYGKAMNYHQLAIKIDPNNKDAFVGVSMDKVELNDYKGAIEFCKKAISVDSTFDTALSTLGWIYYSSGENDECINYSTKALRFNEKSTYAMFNIALATLRKGEIQQAKDLYSGFISLCKEKGYVIGDGPVDDLRDLIRYNMYVPDCSYIITELFKKELWPRDR